MYEEMRGKEWETTWINCRRDRQWRRSRAAESPCPKKPNNIIVIPPPPPSSCHLSLRGRHLVYLKPRRPWFRQNPTMGLVGAALFQARPFATQHAGQAQLGRHRQRHLPLSREVTLLPLSSAVVRAGGDPGPQAAKLLTAGVAVAVAALLAPGSSEAFALAAEPSNALVSRGGGGGGVKWGGGGGNLAPL